MDRTSPRSVRKPGELNAGGGGGRNCAPDVIRYGLTPPNVAPPGGPLALHSPGPTGTVPVHGAVKRSVFRRSTIRSEERRGGKEWGGEGWGRRLKKVSGCGRSGVT